MSNTVPDLGIKSYHTSNGHLLALQLHTESVGLSSESYHHVQISFGAHPAYLIGTRGTFPGDKAAGA